MKNKTLNFLLVLSILIMVGVGIVYSEQHLVISLKAYNGKYVAAEGGGNDILIADRDEIGEWETFKINYISGDFVTLQVYNGNYVTAEPWGYVSADRTEVGEWEIFKVIRLANGKVGFRASSGYYLCADGHFGGLIVADRTILDTWEMFGMSPINNGDGNISYNIQEGSISNSDQFCRVAATDNFLYSGTYARKNNKNGRAWVLRSSDGLVYHKVDFIDNVESLHNVFAGPGKRNVNISTEHSPAIYSIWDDDFTLYRQLRFTNPHGVIIGGEDVDEYGELVAKGVFNNNPVIAGYKDGMWKENIYPTIPRKFIWTFVKFKGKLLAGTSYNPDFSHRNSGSIYKLSDDGSSWDLVIDPSHGFTKKLIVYNGILYALFGKAIMWTEDLITWKEIETPGVASFNLAKVSEGKFLGIWYTSWRQQRVNGYKEGVWLGEFNSDNGGSIKVLKYWPTHGKNIPYWTGGGVVNFKGYIAGFYTLEGRSKGIKITW